jgi:predicted helicase
MRKSPGKKYGYIIIPILVPADVEADKALDDNERYKVVWTVLNALRAHDDRFNATVNKIELNKKPSGVINVVGGRYTFDENGKPIDKNVSENDTATKKVANQLAIQFQELQSVVFARMVNKVGDRRYWEQWAKSVADIATRQTERIEKLITENPKYQKAFDSFLKGLHKNINPSISQNDAIEMLSQHIITKPVFDALFENYSFVSNNPMSQSMQKMLDLLEEQSLEKDAETLEKFYQSVKTRASGIDNAEGKQRIIIELYDKFFKTAFPKLVEKLGIVYSPVEVVDFIIHSVADILQKEFGRDISDENIHLLDPFTGTGTFITRLLQSGLINSRDLARKYTSEIHCNEIVLLAYYIAAVNIENAYHDLLPDATSYQTFEGICLTDTFQLGESNDAEKLFSDMFPQNSKRVQRQQKAPLRIIMGNPPYSVGQNEANDDAKNQSYPTLDNRIAETYAKLTKATNKNSLYDSYIKAYRWSTDRLDKTGGIIAFVSNGAWLDGSSSDGFRKSIEKEFTAIYVFNLRGNQRTSGELSRKEGGKIFGSGSRTPIAITLLVKNPAVKTEKAKIYYHDIGDYLNREEKLKLVSDFKSFGNTKFPLKELNPNEHGDWIGQRSDKYLSLFPLFEKDNIKSSIFSISSNGIVTSRDAWVFNYSEMALNANISRMISFYNSQVDLFKIEKAKNPKLGVDAFINKDAKNISWSSSLIPNLEKGNKTSLDATSLREAIYRPFNKQKLYWGDKMIHRRAKFNSLFPNTNSKNIVIVSCGGISNEKSTIISNCIVDLHAYGDSQCFPLYYYEENNAIQKGMFDEDNKSDFIRRDAISDFILERAIKIYGKNVSKEDIFYYVYGFLHSKEYRETFANDLKKMLPRLPLLEEVKDFWAFSKAGRKLAELHLNYETIGPLKGVTVTYKNSTVEDAIDFIGNGLSDSDYFVEPKMRFPKKDQKYTIIYNSKITISNIPAQAYEYIVNGKSAIEWIMERYKVDTHKDSGIVNNPNDWAAETGNPRYILDLLLSLINVSVQTVDIVNSLPTVNFEA